MPSLMPSTRETWPRPATRTSQGLDGSSRGSESVVRFNLQVPTSCPNVDAKILMPNKTWADQAARTPWFEAVSQAEFDCMSAKLSGLFKENFHKFEEGCSADIRAAAPQ